MRFVVLYSVLAIAHDTRRLTTYLLPGQADRTYHDDSQSTSGSHCKFLSRWL